MEDHSAMIADMANHFKDKDGYGLRLDERTFMRYLRARKFDLKKSIDMLEATLQWRKEFDVLGASNAWMDKMITENETGKLYVRGTDNEGRPLLYMRPRHENTFEHDGNIKHLVYNLERSVACMENSRDNDGKVCLLLDFDGYSLRNAPPMQTSMETLNILQNHYPERLHKAYFLRPPWIFSASFSLISPFIDPVTAAKMVMLRSTKDEMTARLLEDIDASLLETDLGGTDDRVYESVKYLQGDFSKCYRSILECLADEKSSGDN